MPLSRVQATGSVVVDFATSASVTFATTPPTVGNGVIIPIALGANTGTYSCVDNRGNGAYTLALLKDALNGTQIACFFLPKVITTGAPFTITISRTSGSGNPIWLLAAIEVGGVGSGLAVDQVASNSGGNPSSPSTGATPALTAAEVLQIAACSIDASEASIAVATATPAWLQEAEQLAGGHAVGEIDSRIVTSAVGTTPSVAWTVPSVNRNWAAAIVAFKAGVVAPPPDPPLSVSQLVVETLNVVPNSPLAATQVVGELLTADANDARVTQLACELLVIAYVQQDACPADSTFPIDPDD